MVLGNLSGLNINLSLALMAQPYFLTWSLEEVEYLSLAAFLYQFLKEFPQLREPYFVKIDWLLW